MSLMRPSLKPSPGANMGVFRKGKLRSPFCLGTSGCRLFNWSLNLFLAAILMHKYVIIVVGRTLCTGSSYGRLIVKRTSEKYEEKGMPCWLIMRAE